MNDTTVVAFITIGGMLGSSIITSVVQFMITRLIIRTEYQKIVAKSNVESYVRTREKRIDIFVDSLSKFIAITDPSHYSKADEKDMITLIHKIQLLLNCNNAIEKELNGCINDMGNVLEGIAPLVDVTTKYKLHGKVSDAAKSVIAFHQGNLNKGAI